MSKRNNLANVSAPSSKAAKAVKSANAAVQAAELALTPPAERPATIPPPAPVMALANNPPAGDSFDHSPHGDSEPPPAAESGESAAPSTPPPDGGITGPGAATQWLNALIKREPGGRGTDAPWRHAGSSHITRMGREAIAKCGVVLDSPTHEKYNSERRAFWGLYEGRAYLMPDGTIQTARKSSAGGAAVSGDTPANGTAAPGPQRSPGESLAHQCQTIRDRVKALRDSLTGHRNAPEVSELLRWTVGALEAAEMNAAELPDGWGVKPREEAHAPATIVPGMVVEIPEKLRKGPIDEGMIDESDAAELLTVKSVTNGTVAVCVGKSGDRVRLFTRILRVVSAPPAAPDTAAK